jgi:hypothetical protein
VLSDDNKTLYQAFLPADALAFPEARLWLYFSLAAALAFAAALLSSFCFGVSNFFPNFIMCSMSLWLIYMRVSTVVISQDDVITKQQPVRNAGRDSAL